MRYLALFLAISIGGEAAEGLSDWRDRQAAPRPGQVRDMIESLKNLAERNGGKFRSIQ